jgi:phenylpropionate dioxygenase-like ring-hydroxylating dioxygenase large terminal subunit
MVLVRGDDKVIRVLLNTCAHRGALVCRQKAGNAKTFQCPYHAWVFNLRGRLVGVPGEESYGEAFSRDELRLASPAQVDSYRGFIFACFDPRLTVSTTIWPARENISTWSRTSRNSG